MGVNSLWQVLDPIKKSSSLLTVAVNHRQDAQSGGIQGRNGTLTLGVDMATIVAQCNAGALAAGVNHQWAGAGLYVFFKMLTEYTKSPVSLVFVRDGAARPPFKRGHRVQQQPIWMMGQAAELVGIFGYQMHQAPGEAEAELAMLNREGYIHGVISSDSDAILFGTQLLLRSIPKSEQAYPGQYHVYAEDMLTKGSLVLFALLTGGDYGDGVQGCGPTTALALVRCGFGDQLLSAFHRLDENAFGQFLVQWRCAIRSELATNSLHFLSRNQPKLAADISDAFPDRRILDLYINPITSWSPGHNPPHLSQWQFRQPSIPDITRFCVERFNWRTEEELKQKFKSFIWEGIFLQILYSPLVEYNSEHRRLQLPHSDSIAEIMHVSHQVRRGRYLRAYGTALRPKLVVSTEHFIEAMGFDFPVNCAVDNVTAWPPPSLPSQAFYEELGGCNAPIRQEDGQAHRGENSMAAPSLPPSVDAIDVDAIDVVAPSLHPSVDAIDVDHEEYNWVQTGEDSWFLDFTLLE